MGSKTAKSTQAITIPPEVLARYNAINARADTVTNRPFQRYTGEFVAPLTGTQRAGMAATNAAAGMAQPYFASATNQLMGAQQAASPYYQGATDQLAQGINAGNQFAGQSAQTLNNAQGVGNQFAGQSYQTLGAAQDVGNQLAGQSYQTLGAAQDVGNRLAGQSYQTINDAQGVGNQLAGQSYQTLGAAQDVGNQLAGQSYQSLGAAQNIGNQFAGQSAQTLGAAQDVGNQLAGQSYQTLGTAQDQAGAIQQNALNNFGAAYSGAQPYNQAAGGLYQQGLEQGRDFTGRSASGTDRALAGAEPYQQAATQYMNTGAQAVNPGDLSADQINKYLSPYLGTVLQGTAGLLNQQNQQQQAGQMGNAIRSGAFGGDRSGIAAANLNQQQNLANAKIYSDILNQGFGQALGTAQQQQQLGLGAAQANRAAQQQASQQALAIGQQGFGQGLSAAQQQAALGQQLFGMGSTTGQNAAALGQQIYNQGMGTADRQAAMGQQVFGQGATAAAQQAALGQQQFGQGATAAAQQAALGQQQFGQGAAVSERQAALGQQQFGQGATTAAQQAALGQQQFGQGATTAAQQAALGQQQFGQGTAASQQAAALGQGIYGMGANTAAQTAALGTGAQDAALSGAAAQMTAGQVEQATNQAKNTAEYNQFLQEQSLPYQQLKLASDIALGTGTAQGSTTTTTQPGGFFSDERLKENIKAVGKTFDGQTIHSYNYKGDPRTQIGLIAQEVQKHHPNAVGLAGGYKTVNYDKATEDAADRGHMAYGGLASAGGSVLPQDAGQGFASGGVAGFDPSVMQQLLAAQQAMYDPITKGNMYAGGPSAGGGLVPPSEFAARQLMTPAELPRQASTAEQASSIANLGKTVGEIGGEVGAWDWNEKGDKKDDKKTPAKAYGGVAPPRQQYADGGMPYSSQMPGMGLDIPEEDGSSNKYELKTAGDMPNKPESGLDKVGKIAQIAGTVAAMSDKRMKENIKAIGKLFDGQIVHSFNYKGDPRTQIGLIAQEVEDHKPHAVGLAGGMKTVDYDKATSKAARRGHFAMGGQPMDAGLMGAGMAGLNEADREPDFNLDPEDIISGGDPDMEFFMRDSLKKPESPAQAAGLGALENKSAEILKAYKPKAPIKPRPTGLAPKAGGLPKNVMQIARLIRAGEGTGQNPDSTAIGPYQMIDKTFAGQFRQQYPDRARGMSDRDIIALKRSPEGAALSEAMGPKLVEGNARIIERGGFEPDAGNVYLAHFLGPDTAVKVLRANPNAPIANYVSEEAIRANRPLQENPTVGGVIDWARGSMAKQASRLSRASGGLAGRNGYQTAGTVVDEDPDMVARRLFETTETPTEEATPTGVAPPPAAEPAAPAGLAAGEMADPEITVTQSKIKPPVINANLPALNVSLPNVSLPKLNLPALNVSPPAPSTSPPAPNTSPRPNIYGVGDQKPVNYEGGRVPNYSYDYMTEPFFKGLKKGKASSIIPLLTGIAAMGTAPTRSLGVALAAGLGAGAQSYSGLANERNKQLVQRQIGTARYADSVRALFEREAVPLGGGRYYYRGREINQAEYDQMLSDAINNSGRSGAMLPEIPATARTYMPPKAPERAKPVAVTGKPDMTTPSGILLAAFQDPLVVDARGKMAEAKAAIDRERLLQNDPQIQANPNAYSAINSRLAAAESVLTNETATFNERISKLTGIPMSALQESNAAKIGVNIDAVEAQVKDGQRALEIKQTIRQILPNIKDASTLTPLKGKIGQALIDSGMDKDFVNNLFAAPDSTQTQAALASQLKSYGDDPEAAAALKLYGSPQFSAAAVRALLRNAENQADAKISASERAVKAFYANPLTSNVPQEVFKGITQSYDKANTRPVAEPGARYFKVPPKPGDLKPGTVYYVGNQRFVAK